MFDTPTEIGSGYTETIKPGAFKKTLADMADVRMLINHSPDLVLGRTSSGTLILREDDKGLYFECELPPTQAAADLKALIVRGDISQCSFGFVCVADKVTYGEKNGIVTVHRDVEEAELFDTSVVTYPAYASTSVSLRTMFPDGTPAFLNNIPNRWNHSDPQSATDLARVRIALAQ